MILSRNVSDESRISRKMYFYMLFSFKWKRQKDIKVTSTFLSGIIWFLYVMWNSFNYFAWKSIKVDKKINSLRNILYFILIHIDIKYLVIILIVPLYLYDKQMNQLIQWKHIVACLKKYFVYVFYMFLKQLCIFFISIDSFYYSVHTS